MTIYLVIFKKYMKNSIVCVVIIFAVALLAPCIATAQGTTTFLSNLEQAPTGSDPAGSDSWLAANFRTGNNAGGYFLNSVQLDMTDATGNPGEFTVMIYTEVGGAGINPGSSLGTLIGSADPATGGTYTYTAPPDLSLSPGTIYFIVLTAGTTVANGAYEWSLAAVNSYNPNDSWGVITPAFYQSSNGSSWTPTSGYFQYALTATPAPEPGVISLFALSVLLVGFCQWKARSV
jgi:hypothetical protein